VRRRLRPGSDRVPPAMPAQRLPKTGRHATAGRAHKARTPTARSRVTNGATAFLQRLDQRSVPARRFVDVLQILCTDLGGRDDMSEAQYQVARRCAALAVRCELDEALMASDKPGDFKIYGMNASRLGRELQRLGFKGLRRQPRTSRPTFAHMRRAPASSRRPRRETRHHPSVPMPRLPRPTHRRDRAAAHAPGAQVR
jgi:hypothetical protein